VRVRWAAPAEADLEALVLYIAEDSVEAALRVQDRILGAVGRLSELAARGRPGRMEGTRELVVGDTPYLAVYRLEKDAVMVLRVLHGARAWPPREDQR
jgi:toxin ParE1/3/4